MKDFPSVFPEDPYFGFRAGNGWLDLIKGICEKLEPIIAALPENDRYQYRCVQIKEKFGTLRFYTDICTKDMADIIDEFQNKSAKICENCGADGSKISMGSGCTVWVKTLCKACAEKKVDLSRED